MRAGTGIAAVGVVTLVAAVGTTTTAEAKRGSGSGGADRTIRMLDDCDPATFNAAIGEEICSGDGDTTFADFIGELLDDGEADKWRNKPDDTHVDKGDKVAVENLGGEPHTFTRVAEFGKGCVPPINAVLGLEYAGDAICVPALSDGLIAAGESRRVPAGDLHKGHNHFQCMVHPWMTTTIEVRGHRD